MSNQLNTDSEEKTLAEVHSPVGTIGVLGAGTIGHGIAQVAAAAGFKVLLRDINNAAVAKGKQAIEQNLARGLERGKVTEEDRDETLARISTTNELQDLAPAGLIIEAAPENLNLKEPIVVRDFPGFASSQLGVTLGLEAMRMVEQGVASARDIDTAMELGYNHPMGPLRLTDLVGLDVRLSIAEYLHSKLGSETFRPPDILRRMVSEGKLGKKTGRGFYDWN